MALSISFVATLIIAFKLSESWPCVIEQDPEQFNVGKILGQEQKPCFELQVESRLSTRQILRLGTVAPPLGVYFLVMISFNFYYIAFPVYAADALQWFVWDVGVYFSVLSFCM